MAQQEYVKYDSLAVALGAVIGGESGDVLRECLEHLGIELETFRDSRRDDLEQFLTVEDARELARVYRQLATVTPAGEAEIDGLGYVESLETFRREIGDA